MNEKKLAEESEEENIFKSLKIMKTFMEKNPRSVGAIPDMDGHVGCLFTRMIEYLFTKIQVIQYTGMQDSEQNSKELTRTKTIKTDSTNASRVQKKPKGEIILVKTKGKETTYADLLNGDILLNVQNGFEKAEALRRQVEEKVPQAKASHLLDIRIIHIRNLDEVSTVEDNREAISGALGTDSNSCSETSTWEKTKRDNSNIKN